MKLKLAQREIDKPDPKTGPVKSSFSKRVRETKMTPEEKRAVGALAIILSKKD